MFGRVGLDYSANHHVLSLIKPSIHLLEKSKKSKGSKSKRGKSPPASAKKSKSKKGMSDSKTDRGRNTPASDGVTGTESEMEINAADYVPVQKEVIIGKNETMGFFY